MLIKSLLDYKAAMDAGNLSELTRLLDEGRRRKEEVDGR